LSAIQRGRFTRPEHLFALWTRPPQFERTDPILLKELVKRLDPKDRARLLAWLLLYFNEDQRIALNGIEYWLVRMSKPEAGKR
jgi:hypothetical protein